MRLAAAGTAVAEGMLWNPLQDSGDAGQLQAQLQIDVAYRDGYVMGRRGDIAVFIRYGDGAQDVQAATREAITTVAALMGRVVHSGLLAPILPA